VVGLVAVGVLSSARATWGDDAVGQPEALAER
jgi:hypothetical protein